MELSSKEDVNAPLSDVFDALSDFANFERSAIRRGIEVQRLSNDSTPQVGLAWDLRADFRGKPREVHLELATYEPSTLIGLNGDSNSLIGQGQIELLALSPKRTRISVKVKLKAKTLSGRLLLQSLKLARAKVNRRFRHRVAEFASLTEDRLNHTA
ncbi:SRPBCC family protein [Pseudophaeobacter flagellatus]|uniref:SRPBCC family protein n=1 Tax=Pseudophaeobacter flagellatus TaxID=2899119 RepID=UPI001E496752|nr:SRPBCC family protein [Pseudophaeobacter flagellatus]MCD9148104.1 SRPBCC family protein [Pseudophaeobacter flagellatus]